MSWAANYARTTQDETALGARYFFEPDDTTQIPTVFPTAPEDFGSGQFAVNSGIYSSHNQIDESQRFGRLDFDYEANLAEMLTWTLASGGWYEDATRDVDSSFLESPSVEALSQFAILADTPQALGRTIFAELDRDANGALSVCVHEQRRPSRESRIDIETSDTWDVDRRRSRSNLVIESRNHPSSGDRFARPTRSRPLLLFDRLDTLLSRCGSPPPRTPPRPYPSNRRPVDPSRFVDLPSAAIERLSTARRRVLLSPASGIATGLRRLAVTSGVSQI